MPIHIYNLLARAFMAIPATLGSNWLGIVFTVAIVIIGEIIGCFRYGWRSMVANWKKATGIGFAALGIGYTVVFMLCIVTTIYSDHNILNAHIGDLHRSVQGADIHERDAVQKVRDDLGGRLSELKQSCAKTEGANGALVKQASDQQITINNCQTEALKLLVPEALSVTPLTWGDEVKNGVDHHVSYVVLTNKAITPVRMMVICDHPLKSGNTWVMGSGLLSGGGTVTNRNVFDVSIDTPAWTQKSPLRIDLDYTSSSTITCNFRVK